MKYTTFRNTALSAAVLAAMGSAAFVITRRPAEHPAPPRPPSQLAQDTGTAAQAQPVSLSLRDVDKDVLAALKGTVETKVKDALPSRPYKINIFSDDGKRFNRVKIDLNRNDKWDEKWNLDEHGTIERHVASHDDESYDQEYVLKDGSWVRH